MKKIFKSFSLFFKLLSKVKTDFKITISTSLTGLNYPEKQRATFKKI